MVVVGSANVDLVWHGERLPAPGETVTDGEFAQVLGGKGANQAAAAATLGAEVHFVGCVGDDEHGRVVRADLEARGVDCSALATTAGAPTGVARHHRRRARRELDRGRAGANRWSRPTRPRRAIRAGDVVLCSLRDPGRDGRGRGRGGASRAAHGRS